MQTSHTPRPKRNDPAVTRAAVLDLLPAVMQWLVRAGENDTEDDREEVTAQLLEAAKWADADGYELAKRLDQEGWAPDAELVDILDAFAGHRITAHDAAVAAWMTTSGLTAPAIGSQWTCPRESRHPGHVVRNDELHGTATLCIPALGHTPNPGPRGGAIGFVIPWEELTPVAADGGAL
jgi:hypothetical protein